MKVYVVGAGVAGLAAAWDLERAGADVAVLEAERRGGGVIVTERRDGFLVEGGPDSVLAAELEIPALAAELGIANRLIAQVARGSSVWSGGRFAALEEGRAAELLGIDVKDEDLPAGFRSFGGGMGDLIAALVARLGGEGVVRTGRGVTGLTPNGTRWRLALTGGSALGTDAVILAVPAYAAGRWLEGVGVAGARVLEEVIYAPSVTVSLAYREDQLGHPLEGTGFVVGSVGAQHAAPLLRACTFSSMKFAGRAPSGHVLLRAFLAPGDGDLSGVAHRELAAILGIAGAPLWSRVFHWTRTLPRYRPHHTRHLDEIRRRLERLPPLALAGSGFDGRGVSACVRSGREAARVVLGRLGGTRG